MAIYRKEKRKMTRHKFGQPSGNRSRLYRINKKNEYIKKEKKSKVYADDKRTFRPYQLIRKQISRNGKYITNFTVRRIIVKNMRRTKLCCLGTSSSLKFILKREQLTGNRIINIDILKEHVVDISTHVCLCSNAQELAMDGKSPVVLKSEINKSGLFSVILGQCLGCNKEFTLDTSSKNVNGLYDINVRAVWGTVTTGGGPAQLNETLACMDMPQMSGRMFIDIESKIGEWWLDVLKEELLKAGAEERRLAIERNDIHQGVPFITVICDGGWSKRTKILFQTVPQLDSSKFHLPGKKLNLPVDNDITLCSSTYTSTNVIQSGNENPGIRRSKRQIKSEGKSVQIAGNSQGSCVKGKHRLVGRRILHEWVVNEDTGEKKWYSGIVIRLVKGKAGSPKAVYEVMYDKEETATEVDGLLADLNDGSLKILDD